MGHANRDEKPDRNLALELVRVTEAAALAAARLIGRGDKEEADHGGQLAARPRQPVLAHDDPREDERGDGREQEQDAPHREHLPGRVVLVGDIRMAPDRGVRVARRVPGQEHGQGEERPADHGHDLSPPQVTEVHAGRSLYAPPPWFARA